MKRRIVSMLLVLCMTLSMLPMQSLAAEIQSNDNSEKSKTVQNQFSDVKKSDWFYESVMQSLQNGIFSGTGEKSFSPNGTMTRAMYVTVMGKIAKINPADYKGIGEFSDVQSDKWYAPYVKWANDKGITSGIGNGKFNPDGLITREQMATLTVKFFDVSKITYPEATITSIPADIDSVSSYAREAVLKLWNCGLIKGEGNGNFNPKKNATRAEAAAFCNPIYEIVGKWLIETEKNPTKEEAKPDIKPNPETGNSGGSSNSGGGNSDTGGSNSFTVSFMDGEKQLDRLAVIKGQPVSQATNNIKTAKDGFIFVGWFTDKECRTPFYSQDPVNSNLTVYAKYEEIQKENLSLTSFSILDQSSDLSFVIQSLSSSAGDVKDSAVLTVMDGTEPVELDVKDNGDGTYTVKAKGGFREGSSYKLDLGEGYIFKDKAESIRTVNFSIEKAEVDNLALNDDIIYIKDTEEISYQIGSSAPVDVLEPVMMNSKTTEDVTGSFEYDGASTLKANDILCIYETVDPRQRDYVNNDYTDDSEAYVEVTSVNGNTVNFTSVDENEADKIVFMPDTIPFSVEALPSGETGTVQSSAVDNEARSEMGLDKDPEVQKGDFVVFYVGDFADLTEEYEPYYGVVTSINGDTVTYNKTTRDEMEKSMDTFLQQAQKGDALLEGVDTAALSSKIEEQVRKSGFAEDAAEYLAMMATQTEGFKNMSGLTDFKMTDKDGNPLTAEDLELMGIGANIELSDDVKIIVELDKSSKYFKDGIRLALGIKGEFSVDVGDGGELKIDLSATFVEEIAIDITASAHAKVKWYLFVPKFKELTFRSSVDIKNYSAISIDVKMYTVEKEEDSVWKKLKGIKGGKYKKIFEEIEEVKSKIDEAKETADKIKGYKEDLEKLWATVPSDVTNKSEYEGMLDTLGELNVTQELMGMLNLTSETELDAGVRNLMERYSEMLENESDWIELLNKEIFSKDIYIKCFAISISANFVIKGNVNIALGANMEYVVGKRYSFWFDIISKTSGSSQMDLLDERFAFQFYVMGKIGLKMGVEAEIAAGVISTKIGSIGFTAEFGPYVEMWGYFIYEYSKLRPANTSTWTYDEKMMGALYLEFGLYLEMTFKAQAFDNLFKYQPTLLDKKWPLLTAGTRNNVYSFAYEIEKDEVLPIKDVDSNGANGITMALPESYRQMVYIDLCEGDIEQEIYDYSKFNYTLSNRNFAFDKETGKISVTVPKGVQYMECDLTLTWKSDKLAFSLYDLKVTIPLVWTNLSTEELNERFTASVRVGNAQDGYTTVWSKRVMKNGAFDLPKADEIKTILGVDSYEIPGNGNIKYSAINGYGDQQTEGLTILRDKSYYFEVTPRTYTLTVKDVENSYGTKEDKQFSAKFGEAFDLKALTNSGTNDDEQQKYTAFLKVIAKDSDNKEILRDINEPIGKAFAMDILSGATYTAAYSDNSATVVFQFEGVDLEPIEVKMKKGDIASSKFFEEELSSKNAIVKSIFPVFAPITGSTSYTVVCQVQETPIVKRTISYNTNGGSVIEQGTYPVGSVITRPADPTKTGFIFDGWYSDQALTQVFTFTTMPNEDITLYAKWSGNEYTVTFDPNEGALEEGVEDTKTVIFSENYGQLPVPSLAGFGFKGWYTDRTDGDRITADINVTIPEDHTLYAQWSNKTLIDENIISIDTNQIYDYNGEHHPLVFTLNGSDITSGSAIEIDSFSIKYKRQNLDSSWGDTAINAGIYDVKIVRAEDETYDSFEKTFTSVLFINKIARSIDIDTHPEATSYKANILVYELPENAYPGDGTVQYAVSTTQTVPTSGWQDSRAIMNLVKGDYYIFARVSEGENYLASDNAVQSTNTVSVEGIDVNGNPGDYQHLIRIKTSDIAKAGTDSKISGRFYYLDGTSSNLTHFDNDGNDFEQDDLDSYRIKDGVRAPWMITALEIDYVRDGTSPGWHCEYIQPLVSASKIFLPGFSKTFEGEILNVNQWFGAEDHDSKHVVWKGSTDSMKRIIQSVGNFGDIPENISLSSSETESYIFTYDGQILDQYGCKLEGALYVPEVYNSYDYLDAPTLSIIASDKSYKDYTDYNINSVTIDKVALYEEMKAKGNTETTFTVTLKFPERSTTADTAVWTKTITVRIAD